MITQVDNIKLKYIHGGLKNLIISLYYKVKLNLKLILKAKFSEYFAMTKILTSWKLNAQQEKPCV